MGEEELTKEQKREGDSPRARVYRKKDEAFKFSFDDLLTFGKDHDMGQVHELMAGIREDLVKLDAKPDDEEVGKAAEVKIDRVAATLIELGFQS